MSRKKYGSLFESLFEWSLQTKKTSTYVYWDFHEFPVAFPVWTHPIEALGSFEDYTVTSSEQRIRQWRAQGTVAGQIWPEMEGALVNGSMDCPGDEFRPMPLHQWTACAPYPGDRSRPIPLSFVLVTNGTTEG